MHKEEISITDYKKRYYDTFKPGEHHFCSIYLLNKFNRLPDYINPDGTKKVPGDIVFYGRSKDNDSIKKNNKFSIEVKYGEIFFTKTQFKMWFDDKKDTPDFLIALTDNYLFIIEWNIFQEIYLAKKNRRTINANGYSKKIPEEELKDSSEIDVQYFKLNETDGKKLDVKELESKINKRFASLNELIEKRVKR